MESKFTIIVLIILIGILSIVLGVMFGRLTHQFSSQKLENQELVSTQTAEVTHQTIEKKPKETKNNTDLYKTYLMISIDKNVILHNKKVLDKYGYNSSITETIRNDKKVYSLVLDGEYYKDEAQLLGEEIKDKFPTINTYWLEDVNPVENKQKIVEIVEATTPDPISEKPKNEKKTKKAKPIIQKPNILKGPQYRVQLLANTNEKAINNRRDILKKSGYKVVVTNIEKDGTTFYRLRLADAYSEHDGKKIGNRVKSEFDFISGFWLVKIIN